MVFSALYGSSDSQYGAIEYAFIGTSTVIVSNAILALDICKKVNANTIARGELQTSIFLNKNILLDAARRQAANASLQMENLTSPLHVLSDQGINFEWNGRAIPVAPARRTFRVSEYAKVFDVYSREKS